eukprot:s2135_g9.t1
MIGDRHTQVQVCLRHPVFVLVNPSQEEPCASHVQKEGTRIACAEQLESSTVHAANKTLPDPSGDESTGQNGWSTRRGPPTTVWCRADIGTSHVMTKQISTAGQLSSMPSP